MNEFSAAEERLQLPPAPRLLAWRAQPERALLRSAQAGAPEAVSELIDRHWDEAHRAAFLLVRDQHAAEDITQEAMLAAVRALPTFDRRRRMRPWLHRIVVNRSLDWVRARDRRAEVSVERAGEGLGQRVEHGHADAGALSSELISALESLPPEQRAAVVLRHALGYHSREIADLLGTRPATVRTWLRRSLAHLRTQLEAVDGAGEGGR